MRNYFIDYICTVLYVCITKEFFEVTIVADIYYMNYLRPDETRLVIY